MKKEELRIGNYISYEHTAHVIESINVYGVFHRWLKNNDEGYSSLFNNNEIEGFPLTGDGLIKFGFGYDTVTYSKGNHLMLAPNGHDGYSVFTNSISGGDLELEIKYVHELQNLWYALTKTELVWEN